MYFTMVTCTQHRHVDVNVDVNIVVVAHVSKACIYVREWVESRKSDLSHILSTGNFHNFRTGADVNIVIEVRM